MTHKAFIFTQRLNMSPSKLFHALFKTKIATLDFVEEIKNSLGGISEYIFYARIRMHHKRCPCCKSNKVRVKESKERTFRGCNLVEAKTYIKLKTHKLLCLKCGKKRWINLPFAVGKLPMTKSYMNYVISLVAMSTIIDVALHCNLQWKTVKNIHKAHLRKRPKQFSFKKLRYLSIDEIAIRKGHKYMTIFTDISTGQIIYAVKGRKEELIAGFLKQLAKKAKKLRGIAMDMSAGYSAAIKKYLPHVDIVFDRFHVTKVLNKAVDEIRKSVWENCRKDGVNVRKGDRFLLLHNFENLDASQKTGLERLLKVNHHLLIAYAMKEQFRLFWDCKTKEEGYQFLVHWCIEANLSNISQLKRAAKTLIKHSNGLLNYFKHNKINNGKAEGINNKIKTMKRQSYGFRDFEYFILRLYNLHKGKHALVGI